MPLLKTLPAPPSNRQRGNDVSHRPVCTKDEVEYRPHLNGVQVVDYSDNGPYMIWEADEWKCPTCGNRIIVGFGNKAQRHHESDFRVTLTRVEAATKTHRRNFESKAQRAAVAAATKGE